MTLEQLYTQRAAASGKGSMGSIASKASGPYPNDTVKPGVPPVGPKPEFGANPFGATAKSSFSGPFDTKTPFGNGAIGENPLIKLLLQRYLGLGGDTGKEVSY